MGKNPNAKKLKEKKHRERTYSNNVEDLEEEASRLGISVYELEQQRAGKANSSDDSSSEEEQQTKAKKTQLKKVVEEEVKKPTQPA